MAVLFFNLRGVPNDEADDVRALLDAHDIAFYETDAGNWGMSLPAIWLYQAEDLEIAQPLFDEYQLERAQKQRALYLQAKRLGQHSGFWQRHLQQPVRFVLYLAALGLVGYCSVRWVFEIKPTEAPAQAISSNPPAK